jgi:hypothetical protein
MLEHSSSRLAERPEILVSKFVDVWSGLVKRSIKEPNDLHGVFATMVNPSFKEILDLPKDA